jgi:hypothetical protein
MAYRTIRDHLDDVIELARLMCLASIACAPSSATRATTPAHTIG